MPKFAAWQGATTCTGSASPGARALMKWILDNTKDARNLGIYNCRTVRGGSTTSLHGEGRACDVGMPMTAGRGSKAGHALVKKLIAHASELEIQAVIYDRRIWSAKSPNGRAYTGVHPHYDHLHIELTRKGAANLTLAKIREILEDDALEAIREILRPKPEPAKPSGAKPGSRTIKRGSKGDDVEFVQKFIGRQRCGAADGIFGAKTEAGVEWYQKMRGLKVDGVVGGNTWKHLLGKAG